MSINYRLKRRGQKGWGIVGACLDEYIQGLIHVSELTGSKYYRANAPEKSTTV
jgi:hypothetical protein